MAVWTVTTPPASEPLSLAQAKNYLKIPSAVSADDDLITALIIEARIYVERVTGRALINQTITEYFDHFPTAVTGLSARIINLYVAPLVSITEATGLSYVPDSGTPAAYTAWDNTGNVKYFIDVISGSHGIGPARICKVDGVDWPVIEPYANAVKIVYVAGYGAAGSNVPGPLVRAIYKLIGRWYYHPSLTDDYSYVSDLLNPYKIHK